MSDQVVYLKSSYDSADRLALRQKIILLMSQRKKSDGFLLSGLALSRIMERTLNGKEFNCSIDGEIPKSMRIPVCDYRTIYNFYKDNAGNKNARVTTLQRIHAFFQVSAPKRNDGTLGIVQEAELGRLTTLQLCSQKDYDSRRRFLANICGTFLLDVIDFPLPFPFNIRDVIVSIDFNPTFHHLRVRLLGLPRGEHSISHALQSDSKYDLFEHSYFGIGVTTMGGINVHLRNFFFTTAYLFIHASEDWKSKDIQNLDIYAATYIEGKKSRTEVKYSAKRLADGEIEEFAQSFPWRI